MLARVVKPGDKMEMQAIEEMELADGTKGKRKYTTKVFDIVDDDRVEIEMPMEQSKLILLPVDAEYDVYFFTKSGMFQCYVRIIERYKNDRNFVLVAEIISNLRKFQRREYYRYSCVLEMETRVLKEAEVEAISKNLSYLVPSASLRRAIIVDISGGGLRFISKERYRIGEMIYCNYNLQIDGYVREYKLVGKVLSGDPLPNRPDEYSHRVEYVGINNIEREEIIKYIFEEERKNRKREKGR